MNEVYYTIKADDIIVAQNVRAEYVPLIVRGMLEEWFSDYGLRIAVEAQDPNRKVRDDYAAN